jgi:DNA polymerase-3 subunit delta'
MFESIKGHKEVLSKITSEVRVSHFEGVYLFTGPVAVGKFTIARTIGKYLTCIGLEDDSCRCENCRLFPSVPDYLEISKGSGMITVDDVEPISSFLTLVAYRGKSRVVVIDNAHNLNPISANKLLKLLEELPPKVAIILISDSPDRLLPTILSRSYRITFQSLSSEDIRDILIKQGYEPARIADMDRMIPFFSESPITHFSRYSEYVLFMPKFLKDFSTSSEDDLIATIKDIDRREDIEIFLDVFLIFINDIMKVRYDSPDVVSSVRNVDQIEALTEVWKEDICIYAVDRVRKVLSEIRRRINLKPGQLFFPTILWIYYFLNKSIKDKK